MRSQKAPRGDETMSGHPSDVGGNVHPSPRPLPEERIPLRAYGIVHILGSAGLLTVLLILQGFIDARLALAGMFLAIGYVGYRVHFPLHDASHLSLFRSRRANRVVGHICGAMLFTTFRSFQALHLLHHRVFGTADDPAGEDYYGIRFDSTKRMAWFLVRPLFGATLFEKMRDYWGYYSSELAHERQRKAGQSGKRPTLFELVVLLAVQAVMFAAAVGPSGDLWRYPVMYVAPLATVFLFLARLRTFLEHGALEHFESPPMRLARTTLSSRIGAAIISPMRFNYHHEHHRWPGIPSCRLPSLHERLAGEGIEWHREELSTSFAESLERARSAMPVGRNGG